LVVTVAHGHNNGHNNISIKVLEFLFAGDENVTPTKEQVNSLIRHNFTVVRGYYADKL